MALRFGLCQMSGLGLAGCIVAAGGRLSDAPAGHFALNLQSRKTRERLLLHVTYQMLEDYDVWAPCSAVESAHCSLSSRRCTAGEAPAARRLGQRLRQTRRQFPRRPLRSSQLAPRALRGRAGPAGRGWRRRSRGPWGQRRQGDCCPCRAPRPFARAFWLCSGRCCCDYTAAWRWLSLPTYNCMHSSMPLVSGLQSHFLALNRCEHPIFSCAASSGSFQQSEQA